MVDHPEGPETAAILRSDVEEIISILEQYVDCPEVWDPTIARLRAALADQAADVLTRSQQARTPVGVEGPWTPETELELWDAIAQIEQSAVPARAARAQEPGWQASVLPITNTGKWSATYNAKFGAAIWYDGHCMFRVESDAATSRVSEDDPIPLWQKCVDAVVETMNRSPASPRSPESRQGTDA